jgi:hypothetical protein
VIIEIILLLEFVMGRSRSQIFITMSESAGFTSIAFALGPEIANGSLE